MLQPLPSGVWATPRSTRRTGKRARRKKPDCDLFRRRARWRNRFVAPILCADGAAVPGFNPNANAKDRKDALQTLMSGVSAVAVQFGIREIVTLSKRKISGRALGFEKRI